ncbi:hypothetical protein [Pseudomonas moorei]|uniref:hypothetical protein n=1 Tax=Pseudomonas moorei TaxID=395599 RepID=UPI0036F21FC9
MSKVKEAAAGTLDPSFGDNGVVDLESDGNLSVPQSIFALSDGKLLYANGDHRDSQNTLRLRRLHANGFFDSSFGENGSVILPLGWNTAPRFGLFSYQADRLLVKGTHLTENGQSDMVLARLDLDGRMDATFGTDGIVKIDPYDLVYPRNTKPNHESTVQNLTPAFNYIGRSVCVQPDGKILVAHSGIRDDEYRSSGLVFRLLPNGSIDKTFNGTGVLLIELNIDGAEDNEAISIALQKDGKILVCGSYLAESTVSGYIIRYEENGELDTTFNNGRQVVITNPNFKIIAAGTISVRESDNTILVVGTAYEAFSPIPSVSTPWIAVLDADGSFNILFNNSKPLFARVVPGDGSWRNSAWQEDGSAILVSGSVVARYLTSGLLDPSFNDTGWNSHKGSYKDMLVTSDRKLVVIGQRSLLRYLT